MPTVLVLPPPLGPPALAFVILAGTHPRPHPHPHPVPRTFLERSSNVARRDWTGLDRTGLGGRADVNVGVKDLIEGLLEKEPSQRYGTVHK